MEQLIKRWSERPAKWYEFWMPQSGGLGGAIFGTLLFVAPPLVVAALT